MLRQLGWSLPMLLLCSVSANAIADDLPFTPPLIKPNTTKYNDNAVRQKSAARGDIPAEQYEAHIPRRETVNHFTPVPPLFLKSFMASAHLNGLKNRGEADYAVKLADYIQYAKAMRVASSASSTPEFLNSASAKETDRPDIGKRDSIHKALARAAKKPVPDAKVLLLAHDNPKRRLPAAQPSNSYAELEAVAFLYRNTLNTGIADIDAVDRKKPVLAESSPDNRIIDTAKQLNARNNTSPVLVADVSETVKIERLGSASSGVAVSGNSANAPVSVTPSEETSAPVLIPPPSHVSAPVASSQELPPVLMPPQNPAEIPAGVPVSGLSVQSKRIVDSLPQEKSSKAAPAPGPVDITHVRKNALEDETEIKKHNGVGIQMSVKQPKANISRLLEDAYNELLAGDQEGAVSKYRQVLDVQPSNKLALFGLATTYHRAGQINLARPLYGKLLAIDPYNVEGLNNFLVLLTDEDPADALAELGKLEKSHPGFSPIPAQMAIIYQKMGDYAQAVDKMNIAIGLSPENLKYRYDMAVILDKKGDWADAAILYQQLLTASERGEKIAASPEEIQQRLTYIQSNRPKG